VPGTSRRLPGGVRLRACAGRVASITRMGGSKGCSAVHRSTRRVAWRESPGRALRAPRAISSYAVRPAHEHLPSVRAQLECVDMVDDQREGARSRSRRPHGDPPRTPSVRDVGSRFSKDLRCSRGARHVRTSTGSGDPWRHGGASRGSGSSSVSKTRRPGGVVWISSSGGSCPSARSRRRTAAPCSHPARRTGGSAGRTVLGPVRRYRPPLVGASRQTADEQPGRGLEPPARRGTRTAPGGVYEPVDASNLDWSRAQVWPVLVSRTATLTSSSARAPAGAHVPTAHAVMYVSIS
jgi:hypothetical protein